MLSRVTQGRATDDVLQRGFDDFAAWVNPVAARRAQLSGEPVRLTRVIDGGALADDQGRIYEDFLSGYGTQALGHRNDHVAAAVRRFLDSDAPSFFPSGISPYAGRLGRALGERSGYGSVSFASSGTEAVEAALKIARAATGRRQILALAGAYHGCTLGSLSMMAEGPFRDPFGPHLPDVSALPFADLDALRQALAGGEVAAIVVEPLQVEGGVRPLPAPYVKALGELAAQAGTLVIADEVQTGLCRTGPLLASAGWPRRPDIAVVAKSLGGGLLPLSATLTRPDVFQRAYGTFVTADSHHYTFAGNALCAVAGLAALELLTDELSRRVQVVGDAFRQALAGALRPLPLFREVRGAGLLVGIALHDGDHPWLGFEALGLPELAGRPSIGLLLCHRLFRRGYLLHVSGHDWSVVRLQPPLDTPTTRLDAFVTACREELEALCDLL